MADNLIDRDQPLASSQRAPWQAPQVTRFRAAGARAGGGETNQDGDGKS